MLGPLFLGIDCGTQSTKALLVDEHGNVVGEGHSEHDLIERANGAREQDPAWWVTAAEVALKQALAGNDAALVRGIGVSGQQHGLVALDADQKVIRSAKLWCDTETAEENEALVQRLGGPSAWIEAIGIAPLTGYTVSKLQWMRVHEPANFARIRHILLPHDYLNFWLTGKMVAEAGDASGTGFFDVRRRCWATSILDAIDGGTGQLMQTLPKLIPSDSAAGTIRPEIAEHFGLAPTCIVSAGGGDNMMAAIGTGNVAEGVVTLSLGTSGTLYTCLNRPLRSATDGIAPFCSSTGGWLPLLCTMNATNVVTPLVEMLGLRVEDISRCLTETAPGADGITMLPFLSGERTPDLPHATGSVSGLTGTNFTPANLVRAAVEGVTFGILAGLPPILAGSAARRIIAVGGGAKSDGWRQLIADAAGVPVDVPVQEEAGCLGAAMQAMVAYSHTKNGSESFQTVAERCVQFAPGKRALPAPDLLAPYDAATLQHRKRRMQEYGV